MTDDVFAKKLAVRAKLDAMRAMANQIRHTFAPRLSTNARLQRDELQAIIAFIAASGDLGRTVDQLLTELERGETK